MHQPDVAATYIAKLKKGFPDSEWTTLLSDPNFVENAKFGVHIEDSLYARTYEAFKADRLAEVKANVEISEKRFPLGANRDKFIFFNGMAKLNEGDAKGCIDDMKTVVDKYPKSEVSNLAGMIINGVKEGKKLHGGKFDISDVWARRSVVMSDSDSIKTRKFTAERNVDFSFIIAYQTDSINENQLLFELAKYNFSNFIVRNFAITTEEVEGLKRMVVGGFRNYDEALQYARQLFSNKKILSLTRKCRSIIISDKNKVLLGTQLSYDDYDKFYEKHFIPLRVSTIRLLTEPAEIEYQKPTEETKEQENKLVNGGVIDDDTFMQIGVPTDNNTLLPEDNNTVVPIDNNNTIAPEDNNTIVPIDNNNTIAPEDNTTTIPVDNNTTIPVDNSTSVQEDNSITIPVDNNSKKSEEPSKKAVGSEPIKSSKSPQNSQSSQNSQNSQSTSIHFNDDIDDNNYNLQPSDDSNKNSQQNINLEDDYYELDGF